MSYGGGNDQNRTSMASGDSGTRKSYDEQTLIPVTIRMLLSSLPSISSDGALALTDGRDIQQIKFIGAVRAVEEQSTNVSFQIEDGTGLIDVKQWLNNEDCAAVAQMRMDASRENGYVRIIGQVKDYDGKKSVVAHSVRALSTSNELTHHMLEVVYSFEKFRRGGAAKPPQSSTPGATPYGGNVMGQQQQFNASNNVGQSVVAPPGATGAFEPVRQYIKREGANSDMGADITVLKQYFRNQFSDHDITVAIDALSSEGHIYSTIDDTKYKSAE